MIEKKAYSVSYALEKLREVIIKYAPPVPKTHTSEEDNVEYLYDATIRKGMCSKYNKAML